MQKSFLPNIMKTSDENIVISHLFQKTDNADWVIQSNDNHAEGVADLAADFCSCFGFSNWGRLLGLMHDRGKESVDFQRYIRVKSGYDTHAGIWKDKSHSHLGAKLLWDKYRGLGTILANCIAGHHRGLYDLNELELKMETPYPNGLNNSLPSVNIERPRFSMVKLDIPHLTRMLFSSLVDADYLDTERFMDPSTFNERGDFDDLATLKSRLEKYIEKFKEAPSSPLNELRRKIQEHCLSASSQSPGFFNLAVPTGGGKTIASMIWAINHALKHGKRRIILGIPFTSIITQTAQTFREIFGEKNVIEHHSAIAEQNISRENKLATENWDAPIIVTTNVQLFESVFSNRPSDCRKLHSVCDSVVILDEVQSLPQTFLQPIVDSMRSYAKMFGVSFLFCTASQPILDGNNKGLGTASFKGLSDDQIRSLIPSDLSLHDKLRRVEIEMSKDNETIEDISRRISSEKKALCIVNTRRIANLIFRNLPDDCEKIHLSKMMCPLHLRTKINEMKRILKDTPHCGLRVVSTQLIEAGVDIDFPVVFRQLSGLDSILQAAGRCNREGNLESGKTFVFQLEGERTPGLIGIGIDSMRQMISCYPDSDWFAPETMYQYYKILYSKTNTFDKNDITGMSIRDDISYEGISQNFHLIDNDGIPVIINYGESPKLIDKLKRFGPSRMLNRQLGQYSVNIGKYLFDRMLKEGLITEPVKGFYYIPLKDQYDEETGLKVDNEYLEQIFTI